MKGRFGIILVIIIVFFKSEFVYCQISNDEISFLVKLTLYQEASGTKHYKSNEESLDKFMQLQFEVDTLEEEGFDDFIFLTINPIYQNPYNISIEEGPFLASNCKEYILAVHKGGRILYRLKGFAKNDFSSFLQTLQNSGYKKINSHRSFAKTYSVKGLDLGCLFLAYRNYEFDSDKHPCLKHCGEMIYTH